MKLKEKGIRQTVLESKHNADILYSSILQLYLLLFNKSRFLKYIKFK